MFYTSPPSSSSFLHICVSVRVRVCVRERQLETQQKSVSQSGIWRKLAICEEWRAATLDVVVSLMGVVS